MSASGAAWWIIPAMKVPWPARASMPPSSGPTWSGTRTYQYEGAADTVEVTDNGRAHRGTSQFTLTISPLNSGVLLRRRFDQTIANQRADVIVDGQPVGPVEVGISGGATSVHADTGWVTVDVSASTCSGDPAIGGSILASVDIGDLVVTGTNRLTGTGIERALDAFGQSSIEWTMFQPAGGVATFVTGVRSGAAHGEVSVDGGKTWSDEDFATAQFYHVIATNHFPYHVCGAQQDNSTLCGPSRSPGGAIDISDWKEAGGGESGWIAARSDDPDIVYAGSYGNLLTRKDMRTEVERNVNPWPDNPMGHPARDLKYRFQWTFPIISSAHDPNVIYAGSNVVHKSTNGGQSSYAVIVGTMSMAMRLPRRITTICVEVPDGQLRSAR